MSRRAWTCPRTAFAWVQNAYRLTFGGLLLLGASTTRCARGIVLGAQSSSACSSAFNMSSYWSWLRRLSSGGRSKPKVTGQVL